MHRLTSYNSMSGKFGQVHMVKLPDNCSIPSWLVHAQIELDGKRVFVRMLDTGAANGEGAIGLVVSPVY